MSKDSKIEWTEATWNPVTGCTKISPGCKNCYAERFAERWRGIKGHPYEQGFDIKVHKDRLYMPQYWKTPKMIFVNSMSDLFHDDISDRDRLDIFDSMQLADQHIFQVLTKRSKKLFEFCSKYYTPKNVWLGVSVESQEYHERVDHLRSLILLNKRFLSCEPLLGPLNLNLEKIDWVIVGGESGPGARPIKEEWVIDIRNQCQEAKVPFFFKQWGGVFKSKTGRLLEGKEYNEMPSKHN